MDLEKLVFTVDTGKLKEAVDDINALGTALKKVNDEAGKLPTTGPLGPTGGTGPNSPAGNADKVTQALEKQQAKLQVLRNEMIGTATDAVRLGDGFTSAQAGNLAAAKLYGATAEQLKLMSDRYAEYNAITGVNTFDKSASGLTKLSKQFDETRRVTALMNNGMNLTREQVTLLSRDIVRTFQAFKSQNGVVEVADKQYKNLREALRALKSEYQAVSESVNRQAEETKKAEQAAKDLAKQQNAIRNANTGVGDDMVSAFRKEQEKRNEIIRKANAEVGNEMVALFRKNEEAKRKEIEKTARFAEQEQRRLAVQNEGYTPAQAKRIVRAEASGFDPNIVRQQIEAERQLTQAKAERAKQNKANAAVDREIAAATKYLTNLELRLKEQLEETSGAMRSRYTDQLVKMREAIAKSGMSAVDAAGKMKLLEDQIRQVADKDKIRDINNLGRAMSVQLGDVAISLASGMNPLLVLIQQGDQIRGAIQQAAVEGANLSKAMSTAGKQIVTSFIDVGRALGGFVVGAIRDTGQAIQMMGARATGSAEKMKFVAENTKKLSEVSGFANKAMLAFSKTLSFALGTSTAVAVSWLLALSVAFFKVQKEQNELARSLNLTGGALGMTMNSAYAFANSMNAVGISTGKALEVVRASGKTGELFARDLAMVTEAAVNLEKYGKVAIEDTVKTFAELRKDPVKALEEVAKATGMVTVETIQAVRELENQGKELAAQEMAMKAYAEVTKKQTENMKNDYTELGKFLIELGSGIANFFDKTFTAVFRSTPELTKLREEANRLESRRGGVANLSQDELITLQALKDRIALLEAEDTRKQSLAEQDRRRLALDKEAAKLAADAASSQEKHVRKMVEWGLKLREAEKLNDPVTAENFQKAINKAQSDYVKSLEKQEKANNKLSDSEKQSIKDKKVLNDLLGESNELNADFEEKFASIFRLYKSGETSVEKYTKAVNELVKQQPYYKEGLKEEAEALKEIEAAMNDVRSLEDRESGFNSNYSKMKDSIDLLLLNFKITNEQADEYLAKLNSIQPINRKHNAALEEIKNNHAEITATLEIENRELAFKERLLGVAKGDQFKLNVEHEKAVKLAQVEIELQKELARIRKDMVPGSSDRAQQEANAYEIAAKRRMLIEREANYAIAQDAAEQFIKAFEDIRDSLTDVITTALFEGGKAGRAKLRDMLLKPIKAQIEVAITDLVGGFTGGQTGQGAGGIAAGIEKGFSVLTSGFSDALGKGLMDFAKSGMGEKLGLSTKVGDFNVPTKFASETLQPIAGAIGGALQGAALYKGISGGYSTNKATDLVGNIAGAFGPKGVIVAAIAGGINRLFGRKLKDVGVQGSFGGDEGFRGEQFQFFKGGLLRSDKTKTEALDTELQSGLAEQFKAIRSSVALMATTLGVSADSIVSYTKDIKISTQGLTEEQVAEKLQEEFNGIGEDLANLILVGGNYKKANESSFDALSRLVSALTTTNAAFDNLGFKLFETGIAGADAASQFADLFGGVNEMAGALENYYSNFYTEEERVANATKNLTNQLAELGVSALPDTREAFRELVDAAEAAGDRQLVANLIKLSPAFAELVDATEEAGRSVEYYLEKLRNAKRTNEEIAQSIFSMENETKQLNAELLLAQGNTESANAALRALATQGMTEAEIAIYDLNESLRQQISIAEERSDIENDIFELLADTNALRQKELATLDPANRALKEQYYALKDLIDAAEEAAQTFKQLEDVVNQVAPKFFTPAENENFQLTKFATELKEAGFFAELSIESLADKMRGMSRGEIREAIEALFGMTGVTDEMRIVLLQVADGLADFNDDLAETAKELRRNQISAELERIAEVYGDLSVLEPPRKTISEQYVEARDKVSEILAFFGQETEKTIFQLVDSMMTEIKDIRDFRSSLADTIRESRMKGMSRTDRISALRQEEASLFAQLPNAKNPVEVAQKLQGVILQRIQEEADLKTELHQEEVQRIEDKRRKEADAIRSQIDALTRMKNLSEEIAQFTASLRFSDVSPLNYEEQLNVARSLFETTLAGAQAGDENAQANLIENARAYIDEARSFFASGVEYARIFGTVTGALDSLGLGGADVDPQLAALKAQLEILEQQTENDAMLQQIIVDTSVEEVAALTALDQAMATREAQTVAALEAQTVLLEEMRDTAKAQLVVAQETVKELKAELARLNGTTEQMKRDTALDVAAPDVKRR